MNKFAYAGAVGPGASSDTLTVAHQLQQALQDRVAEPATIPAALQALDHLNHDLSAVGLLITRLEDRLSGVLAPAPVGTVGKDEVHPPVSPLTETLRGIDETLQHYGARLHHLIERLEV